jgi:dihydrofolate synthase/folylpolyglutamate synthase
MASSKLSYASFLRRLERLGRFGSKPGLARIQKLLSALGHPEKKYKCILVAGTNGKGSTTAFLASALGQMTPVSSSFSSPNGPRHRVRVGAYYSPHLFSFGERIQINGKNISKKKVVALAQKVLPLLSSMRDDPPTFFEVVTAMALLHFAQEKVDWAVLEVGLGGRLDATNAVQPSLCIITSIGLEHTPWLGSSTRAIAREKAGILREGVPVVCAVQDAPALAVIRSRAKILKAKIYDVKKPISFSLRATGSYQLFNAATAYRAARVLGISASVARHALSRTTLPGRWQTLSRRPRLIIDCAHNPPAMEKIKPDLLRDFKPLTPTQPSSTAPPLSPRVLLFSAMSDKDYSTMLRQLIPHFDHVVLCRAPFARAAKLKDLKRAARAAINTTIAAINMRSTHRRIFLTTFSDPDMALRHARRLAGRDGRVLCTGSIYLLGHLFGERELKLTG